MLIAIKVKSQPPTHGARQEENNAFLSRWPRCSVTSGDPFQRWRLANREAVNAAKAMFDKLVLAVEAQGEPPSQAEADEVSRLRRVANQEFDAAMERLRDTLGSAGGALRQPRIN